MCSAFQRTFTRISQNNRSDTIFDDIAPLSVIVWNTLAAPRQRQPLRERTDKTDCLSIGFSSITFDNSYIPIRENIYSLDKVMNGFI